MEPARAAQRDDQGPRDCSRHPRYRGAHRRGVNVNVTLLFSVERYEQVIDAYIAGLERRLAAGAPVDAIASVASFFVSRVDAKADALLPADSALRGRVAVANAQRAYARYSTRFAGGRWRPLAKPPPTPSDRCGRAPGPRTPPTPTSLYVERADRARLINTMPEATLNAFADHGEIGRPMDADPRDAEETLRRAEAAGIDLHALTAELEREGVRSFCDSYRELLGCIETKVPHA